MTLSYFDTIKIDLSSVEVQKRLLIAVLKTVTINIFLSFFHRLSFVLFVSNLLQFYQKYLSIYVVDSCKLTDLTVVVKIFLLTAKL